MLSASLTYEDVARAYVDRVYRFCFSFFRNSWDAADACQETFVAIGRNRHKLSGVEHLTPWVMTAAYRSCLWVRRKAIRSREPAGAGEPEWSQPAEPLEGKEDMRTVREAIGRLPERYRTALALKYQQNLDAEAMSAVLGISRGALRVLLHRAVARLRQEVRSP